MALDCAKSGKTTAMICSGDSGIYGMAALCYELRGEDTDPEIDVIPGLTAAASAPGSRNTAGRERMVFYGERD